MSSEKYISALHALSFTPGFFNYSSSLVGVKLGCMKWGGNVAVVDSLLIRYWDIVLALRQYLIKRESVTFHGLWY